MTDVETLRDAAKLMRDSWSEAALLAVADWLDFEARVCERADVNYPDRAPQPADEHALAVARAYLSGSPAG